MATFFRDFLHDVFEEGGGGGGEKSVSLTLAVGKWICVASLISNRYGKCFAQRR